MPFEGEHLLPGQAGQFFIILAFVASLISTIAFFTAGNASTENKASWLRFARTAFSIQLVSVLVVFGIVFFICANHYFEYMYAYKHASKELEPKYLLACIWEGQEGSFLLWIIWHSILGIFIMWRGREWEAHIMTVISLAQFFMLFMLLGIYIGDMRIGSSLFSLTRNEIAGPVFSKPDYLNFIRDGIGLNVLLRNYWMVIHPPVLFLGFATTIIPFAYAYAGIRSKKYGEWITPALPWALFSACILGAGIMMGGKWAYESLSFGGYWAWDPVENASLVPWLILVAGLHTMVIYKATGHSLKASYLFCILTFVFILYSTFLTKTGILGDTSVHAFTDPGNVIYVMIGLFVLTFTISSLLLFFLNMNKMPAEHKEERTDSREFWMFIGSLVFFLTSMYIIAKTSVPVINKFFGTRIAPPENVEHSYNKVVIMVAIIIGLLTAVTQYFKYKHTGNGYFWKKILWPTLIAAATCTALAIWYPMQYYKQGPAFLIAIYAALYASVYAVVANVAYIWVGLNGKLKAAGGSIAHLGFALMLAGILISSSNKSVISSSRVNGINLPVGKDPMTRQQDNPEENLTLVRQVPATMGPYQVTYIKDSFGHEKGRRFYQLDFKRRDPETGKITEHFMLQPDVYLMKDNNMSSNPDTKAYPGKDVFTYISYAINDAKQQADTTQFKIHNLKEGDTAYYSNGFMVLNKVERNPNNDVYHYGANDFALMADLQLTTLDSSRYQARPVIEVSPDMEKAIHIDDTVYAQNLFVRFEGVDPETKSLKIGVKESDKFIDFVTLKAYVFPQINLVWLGLILLAFGLMMSAIRRASLPKPYAILALAATAAGLFYMFLLAN